MEISLETVRLANLGSSRVFNKDLGDLISDFGKNADGVLRTSFRLSPRSGASSNVRRRAPPSPSCKPVSPLTEEPHVAPERRAPSLHDLRACQQWGNGRVDEVFKRKPTYVL